MDLGEYGIVATVRETDRVFRTGAKAWIADGTGGEGWYRFKWIAHSRGRRIVTKWATTHRFNNFRVKWIPLHLQKRIFYIRGTREKMAEVAAEMEAFAEEQRTLHPNRRAATREQGHGSGGNAA